MRNTTPILTIIAAVLLAPATVTAQDAVDGQGNRAERRQRILAAFDTDGDGQLSDEERAKARGELANRDDRSDRPRGERQGRGPRPEGPPDVNQLFDRFDENKDNQLSREEFTKLTAALREMRQRGGGGPPDGQPRAARGDRLGPPEDSSDRPQRRRRNIGDGEGFRSPQNPGPAPRSDERGYRGPDGERGAQNRRGEGRGPEQFGPPNPERLFNAFDANGDNQLSREEFTKLTESLRERIAGARERGNRSGPPEEGKRGRYRSPERVDGPSRPPRPPRPEFESADPPEPAADNNSN